MKWFEDRAFGVVMSIIGIMFVLHQIVIWGLVPISFWF